MKASQPKRDPDSSEALAEFANALWDCLGLDPLSKHDGSRQSKGVVARRFYQTPHQGF